MRFEKKVKNATKMLQNKNSLAHKRIVALHRQCYAMSTALLCLAHKAYMNSDRANVVERDYFCPIVSNGSARILFSSVLTDTDDRGPKCHPNMM